MIHRLRDAVVEVYIEPTGWIALQPADPSRLIPALLSIIDDLQKQVKTLKEDRHTPFNPNVPYRP